jgi:hypothetical protein
VPVPNVQWITLADGQRNCSKHVEFRTRINLEISASVGFYCKEINVPVYLEFERDDSAEIWIYAR